MDLFGDQSIETRVSHLFIYLLEDKLSHHKDGVQLALCFADFFSNKTLPRMEQTFKRKNQWVAVKILNIYNLNIIWLHIFFA